MKTKLFLGIQIVAGLLLVLFGLNGFLQFLAMPPANEVMSAFTFAIYKTGYIFPIMAFFMILAGISFIINNSVQYKFNLNYNRNIISNIF